MPPKRPVTPRAPSPQRRQVHKAVMEARAHPWQVTHAHDPYAITAPIDPHSDSAGWGTEDTLRGRPRGVLEYNDC